MKFEPKTEKEIREKSLWPAGEYAFEVIEAADKVSKAGNEMIELKLKVFNDEGKYIFVTDYLLETMAFKLRHIADTCGLSAQYETGSLVGGDFVGKAGRVKLKQDTKTDYPKNTVADYVVAKSEEGALETAKPKAAEKKPLAKELDDDIPFVWLLAALLPALSAVGVA